MGVELEAVAVMKSGAESAKKKMERQLSGMNNRDVALGLHADALKKERIEIDSVKAVKEDLSIFNFLSACFPFIHSTLFDACLP